MLPSGQISRPPGAGPQAWGPQAGQKAQSDGESQSVGKPTHAPVVGSTRAAGGSLAVQSPARHSQSRVPSRVALRPKGHESVQPSPGPGVTGSGGVVGPQVPAISSSATGTHAKLLKVVMVLPDPQGQW